MLRKRSALIAAQLTLLMLFATPFLVQGQNTGKLTGTVIDGESGDPLPGANVVITGTELGTATGANGQYTVIGVPVGTYDIRASFVGYQPVTINNVEITSGYTRQLDFELSPGQELETVVVEYERPMIQNDAIGAPRTVTGEDLQNLPVRGVASVAALQAGVVSFSGSNNLHIRGGREQEVDYYVNGVKVVGALGVPQQAIAEQQMLIGTIPARYGDAMSGVISITTKSGGDEFYGSIEGITSEALDAYGFNQGTVTLGGPLFSDDLGFFISGSIDSRDDNSPYGQALAFLPDAQYEALLQNPQVFQVRDTVSGDMELAPFPTDSSFIGANIADLDSLLAAGEYIPDGTEIIDAAPTSPTGFYTQDDWASEVGKPSYNRDYTILGNVNIAPWSSIDLRIGGAFIDVNDRTWSFPNYLYARDAYGQVDDQTMRGYITWRQRLSGTAFYQLQAAYTDRQYVRHPQQFSENVEDAIYYTDLQHQANSTLGNYFTVQNGALQRYDDGRSSAGSAYGMFTLPGAAYTGPANISYRKFRTELLHFTGSATMQLGLHQLEFGGEFEQRTIRDFQLNGALLSTYIADENGAEATEEGYDSYSDLPYRDVLEGKVSYYGYDFRGLNEVSDQDIAAYSEAVLSDSADVGDLNIAPHKPIYYGGYIQDKLEYKDLVINLGARVDVFDNNTQVLREIYATVPVVRVEDLEGVDVPDVLSSGAVPYYDNNNEIVGYREIGTTDFYDADGNPSEFSTINELGQPNIPVDDEGNTLPANHPSKFVDYEPKVTFMPRIGVSFPVTNQALFFASYNVTSQRPSEFAFTPFNSYLNITGQDLLQNSRLRPEVTTQYELGFRQRITERSALQISGFYRTQENKIREIEVVEAFPASYGSFVNQDFTTTKGIELGFDLRRTNNVAINADYTFQYAQGTGSDGRTLAVVRWLSPGNEPNFISPTAFDQRHSFNASVDYRFGEGEGPTLLGAKVLENFGITLLAVAGSGYPYSQTESPSRITDPQPNPIEGQIGDVTTPWHSRFDLKLDRNFGLSQGVNMRAFLEVENLFDAENAIAVYRATGLPANDGFLPTEEGRAAVEAALPSSDSFEAHYRTLMTGPYNVTPYSMSRASGARIYTLPRRTRIGLQLTF